MSGWLKPTGLAALCMVLGTAETTAATSSRSDALMPGPADPSFSPFVPRSTPKNGESDGL